MRDGLNIPIYGSEQVHNGERFERPSGLQDRIRSHNVKRALPAQHHEEIAEVGCCFVGGASSWVGRRHRRQPKSTDFNRSYGYCFYRNRIGDSVDTSGLMAVATRCIDPEDSHRLAIWVLKQPRMIRSALLLVDYSAPRPNLQTEVWGIKFDNPIGFAAGFDKNAEAIPGVLEMGLGFVEIGSVTGDPQPGNARPRVFRYPDAAAVINRYGFNSDGHQAVRRRLSQLPEQLPGIVGVNLGKNKFASEFDYVKGTRVLGAHSDYLTINVSSPNTPGLRGLQNKKELSNLIKKVKEVHQSLPPSKRTKARIPLLLKIAPDLTDAELKDIAQVALDCKIDGIIISNTTTSRPEGFDSEAGGLSGKPLFDLSTECLKKIYTFTKGRIPLIGCGGVSSGYDAYQKIRSGASLVQMYTSFVFHGPALIPRMKSELSECLERDGFKNVAEAVGADLRQ